MMMYRIKGMKTDPRSELNNLTFNIAKEPPVYGKGGLGVGT